MATFREADAPIKALTVKVMKTHHKPLADAGVTVFVRMAYGKVNEKTGEVAPAMKVRGHRAAGRIKITSHKDRVAGLADAVMDLDGDRWESWSEERQAALISHELTHLDLKCDKDGALVRDDSGRPKMTVKHHDAEVGVFYSVMEEFGADAIDTEVCANLAQDARKYIQPLLDWG